MYKFFLITLFLVSTHFLTAQFPGAGRGGASMNMGNAYGKIVDNKNKGVEAVSIQILQNKMDTITKTRKDVVIAGQLTNSKGEFNMEGLPIGVPLKVKITAIGFKPIERKLQFVIDMNAMRTGDQSSMLNNMIVDLGNVKLDQQVIQQETAVVVGERATLQLGIDRKVFNVEKNIVSAGGTGVDVLRNVPSLQVDIDGNVTLRNNTPQIFVDGRPTQLSLDQIPSDAIASVELITNPSAKFDASGGTSGIINIVLKKNKRIGYYGNIRTNIDSRARVGIGGDINIRQGKVNVFLNANYNQRKSLSWGQSTRINLFENPQTSIIQRNDNSSTGAFRFLRPGFDYFINNRNTLSFSGSAVAGQFNPNEVIDIYQVAGNNIYKGYRDISSSNQFKNLGGTLGFKHLFSKSGQEITADATYNRSKNFNNSDFENGSYLTQDATSFQLIRANGRRKNLTIQTDYVHPINQNSKWEAGLRFNQVNFFNVNDNFVKGNGATDYTLIPQLGYNFETLEKVYAAYSTYSKRMKKTNVQLGLRWESSSYDGYLKSTNQKFNNRYPNSFFPSVFITQSMGKGQDLQFNYTRKINRPNFFQLIPFIDYADSLNITRGNPNLIPEFTNNFEVSYQLPYGKNALFLASTYFKQTENLIARYQTKQNLTGQDLVINSFINANKSQVYGLELTNKVNLKPWWDLALNVNFYGSQLEIPGLDLIKGPLSWFSKMNSTMKLPKNFTLQLSGDYQSRSVLPPGGNGGGGAFGGGGGGFGGGGRGMMGFSQNSTAQGVIKPNWGIDLAIRKDFLKDKKANISFNVNDIFRTRINRIVTDIPLVYQDSWRQRDPQVFRLNFSYRFGKMDATLFKRKNMKAEGEGMRSGMEGGM